VAGADSIASGSARPGPVAVWVRATRIPTLTASLVPVAVGTALAWRDGQFHPGAALAALVGAIGIQIGTNLTNDLFDQRRGADTETRLGPRRALQMGWLSTRQVAAGIVVAFAIALGAGIYLAAAAGWPVVVIGVVSLLSGVLYTASPWALAYNGLGDLFVFVFFGPVAVGGTYFVQARSLPADPLLAALPVGALATAILVVNNVRDLDTDRAAGKRTLAVRCGRGATRAEYVALLAAAFLAPVALVLGGRTSAWGLLPLLVLPLAVRVARVVTTREDGPALNAALLGTARLHALFGALLALGVASR
jgi:1,4-dihydroxy-2-naphthoate octaprenyltransferase